ncbi:MAG: proton-conducting transporter membrane subunit [Bacteroidia bacterium]|nr:hypothetical protein [Bacteroidia bacterium]MDW8015884.1 proton-conducting transporter membrane subunit [Bacteroidia bacterium]
MGGRWSLIVVAVGSLIVRLLTSEPFLRTAAEITSIIALYTLIFTQRNLFLYGVAFASVLTGVALLVHAAHPFMIVAGWELLSIMGWMLIAYSGKGRWESGRAALSVLLTNKLGDVFWIAGVLAGGAFSVGVWVGLFVKVGAFPFTFWLVQAMRAPVPVSALLHSVAVVGIGAYFPLKYPSLAGGGIPTPWMEGIIIISGIAAGIGALLARSPKLILAWSTAAHLCIVLLSSAHQPLALEYLLHHSYLKAALFLLLGVFSHKQIGGGIIAFLWTVSALFLSLGWAELRRETLLIEMLTTVAAGRALAREAGSRLFFLRPTGSWRVWLLVGVASLLIGVGGICRGMPALHPADALVGAGFLGGILYSSPFRFRLDLPFFLLLSMLFHLWLNISRVVHAIDQKIDNFWASVAAVVIRIASTFARVETFLTAVGLRRGAQFVRRLFAFFVGEAQGTSYSQALTWGFVVSLIIAGIWRLWR